MSGKFFITGSGTEIGKTLLTCTLIHQMRAKGVHVEALKPVISGYVDDASSDTAQILKSLGMKSNPVNIDMISPWRFKAALAPHVAAAREGKSIDLGAVSLFCTANRKAKLLLVEGAGGVMAPLDQTHTNLDLMSALSFPAILVVGSYLGAFSHALTAAETLRAKNIPLQAVIVSQSAQAAIDGDEMVRELSRFLPYARHVMLLPRLAGKNDLWQAAPDMTGLLS